MVLAIKVMELTIVFLIQSLSKSKNIIKLKYFQPFQQKHMLIYKKHTLAVSCPKCGNAICNIGRGGLTDDFTDTWLWWWWEEDLLGKYGPRGGPIPDVCASWHAEWQWTIKGTRVRSVSNGIVYRNSIKQSKNYRRMINYGVELVLRTHNHNKYGYLPIAAFLRSPWL